MELFGYYIPDGEHDLKDMKKVAGKKIFDGGGYNRVKCRIYKGKTPDGNDFLLPVVIAGKNTSLFWFIEKTKSAKVSENDIIYSDKKGQSMTKFRRRSTDNGYTYNYGDVKAGKDSFQCSLGTEFLRFYKKTAENEKIKPLKAKQASTKDIIAKAEGIKSGMHGNNAKIKVDLTKNNNGKTVAIEKAKQERVARRA